MKLKSECSNKNKDMIRTKEFMQATNEWIHIATAKRD